MKHFLILISIIFSAQFSQAMQISMYERGFPINVQPVDKIFVQSFSKDVKQYIRLFSSIRACPNYPAGIAGDVYLCSMPLEDLANLVGNRNILNMNYEELRSFILSSDKTITCNTNTKPELINYEREQVYYFVGTPYSPQN